ncbi:MAG: hypothetical protein Q9212_002809 [Teloschistes hypoglaucus]
MTKRPSPSTSSTGSTTHINFVTTSSHFLSPLNSALHKFLGLCQRGDAGADGEREATEDFKEELEKISMKLEKLKKKLRDLTMSTTTPPTTPYTQATPSALAQSISGKTKRQGTQETFRRQHDESIKKKIQEDPEGFKAQQEELLKISRNRFAYDGTRIKQEPDSDDDRKIGEFKD